jgi:hypothetical protein
VHLVVGALTAPPACGARRGRELLDEGGRPAPGSGRAWWGGHPKPPVPTDEVEAAYLSIRRQRSDRMREAAPRLRNYGSAPSLAVPGLTSTDCPREGLLLEPKT